MALVASQGLHLLVGDGAGSEAFAPLKGAALKRLEITQRAVPATAIRSDAWQMQAACVDRRAVLECEAYATDEAPATRLRSLAFSGLAGNIRLLLSGSQTLMMAVRVTQYTEITSTDDIKRLTVRLESAGVPLLA
jgi:hypothetical protein